MYPHGHLRLAAVPPREVWDKLQGLSIKCPAMYDDRSTQQLLDKFFEQRRGIKLSRENSHAGVVHALEAIDQRHSRDSHPALMPVNFWMRLA